MIADIRHLDGNFPAADRVKTCRWVRSSNGLLLQGQGALEPVRELVLGRRIRPSVLMTSGRKFFVCFPRPLELLAPLEAPESSVECFLNDCERRSNVNDCFFPLRECIEFSIDMYRILDDSGGRAAPIELSLESFCFPCLQECDSEC